MALIKNNLSSPIIYNFKGTARLPGTGGTTSVPISPSSGGATAGGALTDMLKKLEILRQASGNTQAKQTMSKWRTIGNGAPQPTVRGDPMAAGAQRRATGLHRRA